MSQVKDRHIHVNSFSQPGRLARPSSLFLCLLQLLLTGKFGRQESRVIVSNGVRSLWAPVSLYGPSLILHFFAFIECWRSVSNLVSFSRKFTSPSRCSMSASWLKTWTAVWPPLFFVSESGNGRDIDLSHRIPASAIASTCFFNVRAHAVIEGRRRSAPAAGTWITAWNAYALTDAFRGGCSVVEIGSQFKAIQHITSVAVC